MQVGRETGRQLESMNGGSPAPYHYFHVVPLPNHLVCLWQQVLARGGVAGGATGMCRVCHMVQVGQVSGVHIGCQPREPVLHQFVAGGKVVRAAHHTPAVPPPTISNPRQWKVAQPTTRAQLEQGRVHRIHTQCVWEPTAASTSHYGSLGVGTGGQFDAHLSSACLAITAAASNAVVL